MQEKCSSLAAREEKLWKDMPLTKLPEMLTRLTKSDLDEIRISLGVRGASSLKKQDLITKLVEAIMTEAAGIFSRFDEERYDFVKQVALNGGCFRNPQISLALAEYFRKHGLLFTGQSAGAKVIAVSDEVLRIFNQVNDRRLAEQVKRNTQWIRLTHGLLYYYGVLSLEALIGMVAERSGKPIDAAEFVETIGNSVGCYDRIDFTDDGFCDARVEDPEKILGQQSDRLYVDYYPFSNDSIFQAGAPGFKEKTKYLLNLLQFIQASYDIAADDLDEIGSDCLHIINNTGHVNSVINYLNGRLEFPSMEFANQVIDRAIPLFNNTRQWSLKGFAPSELKQKSKVLEQSSSQRLSASAQASAKVFSLPTGQRIGRNDPCPCGSGQKFKRCCGK